MPLTSADVLNMRFSTTRLRPGYDEEEVDAFLDVVAAELDRLTQENEELRAKLAHALRGAVPKLAAQIVEDRRPPAGGTEATYSPRPLLPETGSWRSAEPESESPGSYDPSPRDPATRPVREHRGSDTAGLPRVAPGPLPLPLFDPPAPDWSRRPGRAAEPREIRPPAESVEYHDDGEVTVFSFDETERLLFDRADDGQILNWTTALSPSAAGALALELVGAGDVGEASICVDGETGGISPGLIASLIRAHPPAFDSSCEFFRIDFDDKSIAYQSFPREDGPRVGFLGIAAERLPLTLVASLIIRTGTRQVVGATLDVGENRLLDRLDMLLTAPASRSVEGGGDGRP
ncbi:DivIVA domain-containing protein [Spirillospora sp. CA-142024]|uniref:DivIVA domain-containing protein n=1 Tax=Spirillospora sp. CA-142024 TaxID=3240036 RepID=UPI003D8B3E01